MKPDFKKWQAAHKAGIEPPFQIALFIRTEAGRAVEVTVNAATPAMRDGAYDLLQLISSGAIKTPGPHASDYVAPVPKPKPAKRARR